MVIMIKGLACLWDIVGFSLRMIFTVLDDLEYIVNISNLRARFHVLLMVVMFLMVQAWC